MNVQLQKNKSIALVSHSSTGEAIKAASNNPKIAAIGSKEAANLFEVPIVKKSFQDRARNETRFVIMKLGNIPKPSNKDKTMFLVEVSPEAGALAQLLTFSENMIQPSDLYESVQIISYQTVSYIMFLHFPEMDDLLLQ